MFNVAYFKMFFSIKCNILNIHIRFVADTLKWKQNEQYIHLLGL